MLDEGDQPGRHEPAGPHGIARRVTSRTSTTPRVVTTSIRRPALVATMSNVWTPWPVSTTASTRSPFIAACYARAPRAGATERGAQVVWIGDLEGGLVAVAVLDDVEQRHPLALLVDAVAGVRHVGLALRRVDARCVDLRR